MEFFAPAIVYFQYVEMTCGPSVARYQRQQFFAWFEFCQKALG